MNVKLTLSHFRTIKFPIEGTQSEVVPFSETPKNISLSIQTLIPEVKPVVFEKEELEHRDNPIRRALLPLLLNQSSDFDVGNILRDF